MAGNQPLTKIVTEVHDRHEFWDTDADLDTVESIKVYLIKTIDAVTDQWSGMATWDKHEAADEIRVALGLPEGEIH